jgi:HSP20 family protein
MRFPFPSPFEPNGDLEKRMERFFDDTMMTPTEPLGIMPPVEIAETPVEYTAAIELPGLTRKDIELAFENGMLTVRGEKRDEREMKDPAKRFHVWERSYGSFKRAFTFPGKVNEAEIKAEMKDGILTIHLPKTAEEAARTRKIEIEAK